MSFEVCWAFPSGKVGIQPGRVDHLDPGFPVPVQLQMILQQLAQQSATVGAQPCSQLGMGKCAGPWSVQEAHHGLEQRPAGVEPAPGHPAVGGAHRELRRPVSRPISAARPCSPSVSSFACAAR